MGYSKKDIEISEQRVRQLQEKQGKEAKKSCKSIQDNLPAIEAKLARHTAAKQKRIDEHRADIEKTRKRINRLREQTYLYNITVLQEQIRQ